jgi:hypothetical protein
MCAMTEPHPSIAKLESAIRNRAHAEDRVTDAVRDAYHHGGQSWARIGVALGMNASDVQVKYGTLIAAGTKTQALVQGDLDSLDAAGAERRARELLGEDAVIERVADDTWGATASLFLRHDS